MTNNTWLIPTLPLAAFTVNILFGRWLKHKAAWISIAASLASSAIALPVAWAVVQNVLGHGRASLHAEIPWLWLGDRVLTVGYLLDPLAATLLFSVTIVGTLIIIYSTGYMHADPRYSRFFAYLSLFMSAMLTLVIANNYILFFMAWEVMGLCSYLLIGFWFEKESAANASQKAFWTTRAGDVGFFLGILTLYRAGGTLDFADLPNVVHGAPSPLLPLAALLIFCGTIGKSAQFPLHVWLPDAMEGPTPVSALIHAATMVAAGVFLVARSFVLFEAFPHVMQAVVAIGTLTAFMAAFIAVTATDIKRILAYSTISQLGFMVTALGLGGLAAGIFHLTTHAFFKALLFLGAGSVIHGTGSQDIRELGGLFGKMKHTALTFIIAWLAISGVPPLSGFWSKDEILLSAYDSGNRFIYYLLLFTALLTAFYMSRLVFLTFFGPPHPNPLPLRGRGKGEGVHESPWNMTLPLWILALGSILAGLPGSPWMDHWFQEFMGGTETVPHHTINVFVMGSSVAAGLGGILLAAVIYLPGPRISEALGKALRPLYLVSVNKFWIDEIYGFMIVRPIRAASALLDRFDQSIIDGAVNGTGFLTVLFSRIQGWIDQYIVDGLVNFTGYVTQFASASLRRIQTGFVQHYLLIIFLAGIVLMFLELRLKP